MIHSQPRGKGIDGLDFCPGSQFHGCPDERFHRGLTYHQGILNLVIFLFSLKNNVLKSTEP